MWKNCCAALALLLCMSAQAEAHFGMVIPRRPRFPPKKDADLKLDIAFAHPMELQGMDMAVPKAFTVTHDGKTEDLKATLKPAAIMGHKAWQAAYKIARPGVYQFAVEPTPTLSRRKTPISFTTPRPWWPPSAKRKAGPNPWASRPK